MKPSPAHPTRDQLLAFASGRLEDAERNPLEKHIENCDECCQVLRSLPEDDLLRRLRLSSAVDSAQVPPGEFLAPAELVDHPRYKVGRFLGAGGMGAVFLAEHRMMGRPVALKIIHRRLTDNPRVIERFRQEVRAAGRLTHANIVAAYDAEQVGDVHFLVMEYVDGLSLDRVVAANGPLPIAYACQIARQAARGLQHAFEAGMVHRDVKPHNLMVTRKGQVKILDFGLARLASETRSLLAAPDRPGTPSLTQFGEIMGTPGYMAPEQIASPHDADIRADIYSLGCTLHFMLTGPPPLAADSVGASLGLLRRDVPAALVAIIDRMLAKRPADRYAVPAEFIKAMTEFLSAPPPPVVRAEPPRARVTPPIRMEPHVFEARCPFCAANIRTPDTALGASISCPQCGSYFTAVPAEPLQS